MAWKTQFKRSAQKQLAKLDKTYQIRILKFLDSSDLFENPRSHGLAMKPTYNGCWRYRVGMYRIVCELQDDVQLVLVIEVDKRGDIY